MFMNGKNEFPVKYQRSFYPLVRYFIHIENMCHKYTESTRNIKEIAFKLTLQCFIFKHVSYYSKMCKINRCGV